MRRGPPGQWRAMRDGNTGIFGSPDNVVSASCRPLPLIGRESQPTDQVACPPRPPLADALALSGRQVETVRAILRETDDADIASELGISRRTVRAHVERVYTKLDVHNRLQFALRVFEAHLRNGSSRCPR